MDISIAGKSCPSRPAASCLQTHQWELFSRQLVMSPMKSLLERWLIEPKAVRKAVETSGTVLLWRASGHLYVLLIYGLLDVLRPRKKWFLSPLPICYLRKQFHFSFFLCGISEQTEWKKNWGNEKCVPSLSPINTSTWGIASIKTWEEKMFKLPLIYQSFNL